jgi:hypothetical protein
MPHFGWLKTPVKRTNPPEVDGLLVLELGRAAPEKTELYFF